MFTADPSIDAYTCAPMWSRPEAWRIDFTGSGQENTLPPCLRSVTTCRPAST
jgi:hypothetical protein